MNIGSRNDPFASASALVDWKAVYDFSEHGPHVDAKNVVFSESAFNMSYDSKSNPTLTGVVVFSLEKEKCLRVIFDVMALNRAEDEGVAF